MTIMCSHVRQLWRIAAPLLRLVSLTCITAAETRSGMLFARFGSLHMDKNYPGTVIQSARGFNVVSEHFTQPDPAKVQSCPPHKRGLHTTLLPLPFSATISKSMTIDAVSSTEALADLGLRTIDLFGRVEKALKKGIDEKLPEDSFTFELQRFELWAANMGLFVPGHGSLDYRVREAEKLAQTLRRFLQDLNTSLEDGK